MMTSAACAVVKVMTSSFSVSVPKPGRSMMLQSFRIGASRKSTAALAFFS